MCLPWATNLPLLRAVKSMHRVAIVLPTRTTCSTTDASTHIDINTTQTLCALTGL